MSPFFEWCVGQIQKGDNMRYTDEDIEYANLILTDRENLDDAEVDEWMKDPKHIKILKEFAAAYQSRMNMSFDKDKSKEFARLEESIYAKKSRRMTLRWSVAASIVLLIGLYVGRAIDEWRNLDEERLIARVERAVPGVKAELILGTGERVVLTRQGALIEGMQETGILNDSLNGLNYANARVQEKDEKIEPVFNTLRIPVGGYYRLTLADGTKVWLNSKTELRYPVTFNGEERKVFLTGEAYFEVTHDEGHPFIVSTDNMNVKVYGTEFNVNTYQKGVIQTTLVNGKVGIRVNSTGKEVILKPNQMAEFEEQSGTVQVKDVDPYAYIAWRNGEFVFERETIEEIMERLSRWYDVKVFYTNESVKQKRFTGVIDRYDDIEQVLRLIEGPATLRFEVKGNTVTVQAAGNIK